MSKARPKPSKPSTTWEIYHLARSGKRLGTVKASDAEEALQKAVEEFGIKPQDVPRTLVRQTT